MNSNSLIGRGLSYYWRTNAAVILGVAVAVAVLSGALLVGDSVRGSLSDLVDQRLGAADLAVTAQTYFREMLAGDLRGQPGFPDSFTGICPLIATEGVVTAQQTAATEQRQEEPGPNPDARGARAGHVRVYGVDDRFWKFQGMAVAPLTGRQALIGAALSDELGAGPGATILIRVEHPSALPLESLHARKDDRVRTLRVEVASVIAPDALGEFSLDSSQGVVRAVFLPLSLVQEQLDMEGRVNTLLVSLKAPATDVQPLGKLTAMLRDVAQLEDLGLRVRVFDDRREIALDSDSGVMDDARTKIAADAAQPLNLVPHAVFTYLANRIRIGDREVPYSLVTARAGVEAPERTGAPPPIELNTWAAEQLKARVGDPVRMEYYVWEDPGQLVTRTAEFEVTRIVPLDPTDRALAPEYPGITDSPTLEDWSPPFPIDLRRVRKVDEEYWKQYRTTPKAFIPLEVGQKLWGSRYGSATSVRISAPGGQSAEELGKSYADGLRRRIDPLLLGLVARDVRAEGEASSRGATDFGLYFVYFSFFLVVAALIVTALFFRLNIEQRAREIGLLRATGFGAGAIRRLFMGEAAALALTGAVIGMVAGVAYAALLIAGLRTWWIGAVGTTALRLHVAPVSLLAGGAGGVVAALVCVWLTLRSLSNVSERRLLSGFVDPSDVGANRPARRARRAAIMTAGLGASGAALVGAGALGLIDQAGAFFGAGALLVAACLSGVALAFRMPSKRSIGAAGRTGRWPIYRLGLRNASFRPARSVAAMAAIAAAAFILISVDAFRRSGSPEGPHSGTGGYALAVDLLIPIARDPDSAEGRRALNLEDVQLGAVEPFRVRPGDDASCLNLYAPANPRILAPRDHFLESGRFSFKDSVASTPNDQRNPWLLLNREEPDGAIPVIADANSLTYVLKRSLGDDIVITANGQPTHLRVVAALDDSIFQSELIMSERHFQKLFPGEGGYAFLLAESGSAPEIEEALSDYGADASSTAEKIAAFHRVENTYISTFQMLGGLGLLLGTAGLGAVLLRSAAERRKELALLGAIGYQPGDFLAMTLAENGVLLGCGMLIGALCALVAIAPALAEHGGHGPSAGLLLLLAATFAAGLLTSLIATAAVLRSPLLSSLRSE